MNNELSYIYSYGEIVKVIVHIKLQLLIRLLNTRRFYIDIETLEKIQITYEDMKI